MTVATIAAGVAAIVVPFLASAAGRAVISGVASGAAQTLLGRKRKR